MREWTSYTTADEFATDPTFRDWVASGQFGQLGDRYTQYLTAHAHLYPLAQQAADLLRVTSVPTEAISSQDLTAQIEATWGKIRQAEAEREVPIRSLYRTWLWRAAAMLLLVGGIGWWATRGSIPETKTSEPFWQVAINQQATRRPLSLADGSVVWLSPGSSLRYPSRFASDRREVTLTGEAFFEVHKNARQPFYVKTSQMTARVVGTSFLVSVLPNDKGTLVQVRTGKVLIYRNAVDAAPEPAVPLRANQELRVARTQEPLVTQVVKQPSELTERLNEQPFEFTDAPVSEVLRAIAKAYDVPIDYDPTAFQNCLITTALADEPLTEKLIILAETIGPGTRAELINNRIRLTGTGCP